jgi:hypothetical protein
MAGQSILDMIRTNVQQGIQSAGNALFSGAPAKVGSAMSAADELAKLQKDGPPDAMHYGAWQDRMAQLQQQIRGGKK